MSKPLEGVRIADFSHVFAGPFATYYLALLGAEVIKVELPGRGDGMRYYGNDTRYHGISPNFVSANAGKRSIAIDLKSPEGIEVAKKLIASSDVVMENFRPGAMRRLGLGYDVAKALRPDIIYCSVSGYGQSGPKRDYAAIDNIVQATSGMMDANTPTGEPPMSLGYTVVDTYTATSAAMAILAALFQRQRDGTGQFIDVAMLDSSLTLMASIVGPYLALGDMPQTAPGRGFSNSPGTGLFTCKDGKQVSIGVVQDAQFQKFTKMLGREDLANDERFADRVGRADNRDYLVGEFEAEIAKFDADDFEAKMNAASLPCGVVRSIPDALDDPNLMQRGTVQALHMPGFPDHEDIKLMGLGFRFEKDGPSVAGPAPYIAEHTVEILELLGYSEQERAELLEKKAVEQGKAPSKASA